ncbi:ABC transporter ATP-binding protein [Bacteroidales bacterium Barb6XT]|nr:ABC transporter ATP-binding protein [Bacteroidales bacterium Barb6XT]OAV71901.1 ABC transporter ATP-binding protein [Bacteroidales bacterium Barb4]
MLSISELSVSFGGVKALNLSKFELNDKELRVIIGPNGAGKSTFMDVLCGKTAPSSGTAYFNGEDLIGKSEVEIARMGVGRKFQKPSVFEGLTVFDNLLLGLKAKKGFLSSMFFKLADEESQRIREVAKRVNLENELYSIAGSLSHGQKQWLEIAIVLLQDSDLMLIDEPAAGMSDAETERTGALLCELSKENGVIVIEHDMHFVEQIAREKVTVLVRGEILTEGSFDEVKNNQDVIDCYLGTPNSAQTRK